MPAYFNSPVPAVNIALFGTGIDGNVTISSGTTTATRNMHYTNLTISGTGQLDMNGFILYVSGTLDISAAPANAIIACAANYTAAAAAVTTTPGAASAVRYVSFSVLGGAPASKIGQAGGVGANGGNGAQGGSSSASLGGSGGASGKGGDAGLALKTGGTAAAQQSAAIHPQGMGLNIQGGYFNAGIVGTGNPGGFSGASGGGGGGGTATSPGGSSGGSGSGGTILAIFANILARGSNATAGVISCVGQTAGTSSAGTNAVVLDNGGGGGGSGGGGGGYIFALIGSATGSSIANGFNVSGGAGATGGNGGTTGTNAGSGGDGGQGGNGGGVDYVNLTTVTYTSLITDSVSGTAGSAASGNTGGNGGAGAVARLAI